MEFWSTGLGKRSMAIDIGSEEVKVADDVVLLSGMVKPPLSWRYTITMDTDDWTEFLETAFHPVIIGYLLKPAKWRIMLKAGMLLSVFFIKYSFYMVAGIFRKRKEKEVA